MLCSECSSGLIDKDPDISCNCPNIKAVKAFVDKDGVIGSCTYFTPGKPRDAEVEKEIVAKGY